MQYGVKVQGKNEDESYPKKPLEDILCDGGKLAKSEYLNESEGRFPKGLLALTVAHGGKQSQAWGGMRGGRSRGQR